MDEYRYRKHVRYVQSGAPAICFLGILVAWVGAYFLARARPMSSPVIHHLALVFTAFLAAEGFFLWWFMRRFARVRVRLEDDGIVYENIKGVRRIPFADIVKVECPSVRYAGGWLKISTAADSVRLTVILERIGDFIKNLKAALDQRSRQDAYDAAALFRFYKTAEFADQAWERFYEVFPRLVLLTCLSAAAGIAAAIPLSAPLRILVVALALGGPLIVHGLAEFWIARRIAQQADEASFSCPGRDRDRERRVYRTGAVVYAALFLAGAAFMLLRLSCGTCATRG